MELVAGKARSSDTRCFLAVLLRIPHCYRAGIGGDAVTVASKEARDRQASDLAGKIPQGHVDSADRAHGGSPLQLVQVLPKPLAVEGVLPHHDRFQVSHQRNHVQASASDR